LKFEDKNLNKMLSVRPAGRAGEDHSLSYNLLELSMYLAFV